MTNTVYENLYDIVEQRLKEYDGKMLCRKDVYLEKNCQRWRQTRISSREHF